eukprot:scaffold15065_cov138-Skeletonema_dohrnii-CCMP3373.AAC.1
MLKLEFKRTCMKQISLLMIEPSRAEASELIIYLLKSFLLFPNKEFRRSLAGSGQIIRDGPACMYVPRPAFFSVLWQFDRFAPSKAKGVADLQVHRSLRLYIVPLRGDTEDTQRGGR